MTVKTPADWRPFAWNDSVLGTWIMTLSGPGCGQVRVLFGTQNCRMDATPFSVADPEYGRTRVFRSISPGA